MTRCLTPYQLRFCPARYIDEGHVPTALLAVRKALPDWRQRSAINAWLLDELGLPTDYQLPPRLGGLALFGQVALQHTLRCLGGLLHGQALRQALTASVAQRVRAALGETGHRYCLQQLDVIIGPWPTGWQGTLPDGDLGGYLQTCGLEFWLSAAGDIDSGCARRLRLRLPPGPPSRYAALPAENPALAQALCLKVARQVSPECCHLLK